MHKHSNRIQYHLSRYTENDLTWLTTFWTVVGDNHSRAWIVCSKKIALFLEPVFLICQPKNSKLTGHFSENNTFVEIMFSPQSYGGVNHVQECLCLIFFLTNYFFLFFFFFEFFIQVAYIDLYRFSCKSTIILDFIFQQYIHKYNFEVI